MPYTPKCDQPNKRQYLRLLINQCDVKCMSYSPGDGKTRYRFFASDDPSEYFGPSSGMGTVLGISEAITWMEGYRAALYTAIRIAARIAQ